MVAFTNDRPFFGLNQFTVSTSEEIASMMPDDVETMVAILIVRVHDPFNSHIGFRIGS
jgi:hypothetical protein